MTNTFCFHQIGLSSQLVETFEYKLYVKEHTNSYGFSVAKVVGTEQFNFGLLFCDVYSNSRSVMLAETIMKNRCVNMDWCNFLCKSFAINTLLMDTMEFRRRSGIAYGLSCH